MDKNIKEVKRSQSVRRIFTVLTSICKCSNTLFMYNYKIWFLVWKSTVSSNDVNYSNVLKSLYNYGEAAKAYFG